MTKNTIAIVGATGHIGHALAEELLKKGHKVHAVGRDKAKLQKLKEKGAEVFACNFEDPEALTQAFTGCQALFSFIPPGQSIAEYETYQDKVGEAIKQAIIKTKIPYVINLSSIGAQLTSGTGVIKGLQRHEKRLNTIPNLNVLHFRPGYFMENLFLMIPIIKNLGFLSSPLKADLSIPMVATKDIASKIAELFDGLKFRGQTVFEFVGPRAITLTEVATTLGKTIGKPELRYVQATPEEAEKGMLAMGMKPKTIKLMLEMYRAFNEGKIPTTQQITSENKGKTTVQDFAKIFAKAYLEAREHLAVGKQ